MSAHPQNRPQARSLELIGAQCCQGTLIIFFSAAAAVQLISRDSRKQAAWKLRANVMHVDKVFKIVDTISKCSERFDLLSQRLSILSETADLQRSS